MSKVLETILALKPVTSKKKGAAGISMSDEVLSRYDNDYTLNEVKERKPLAAVKSRYDAASMGTVPSLTVCKALALFSMAREGMETDIGVGIAEDGKACAEIRTTFDTITAAGTISSKTRELSVYDPVEGLLKATVGKEDPTAEKTGGYSYKALDFTGCDPTIYLLPLIPTIISESEAFEAYQSIDAALLRPEEVLTDAANNDAFWEKIAIITSNIVSRCGTVDASGVAKYPEAVVKAGCKINLATTDPKSLPFAEISKVEMEEMAVGSFAGFGAVDTTKIKMPKTNEEANGIFAYGTQKVFKRPVERLKDSIKLNELLMRLSSVISKSTGMLRPIRTILLSGSAGSGKSEATNIVAALLGRPRVLYVCHPETSINDLLGWYSPVTVDDETLSAEEKADIEKMKAELSEIKTLADAQAFFSTMEITEEERNLILNGDNLPSYYDLEFDPKGVYENLTGQPAPADFEGEPELLYNMVLKKIASAARASFDKTKKTATFNKAFKFVPSEIVEGLMNGYVVEIAEATKIVNSGTLASLNEFMLGKSIKLPNGDTVERHPESVLILTSNVCYVGDRPLEQSILSRCQLHIEMNNPSLEEMIERAKKATGCTDDALVRDLATKVQRISDHLNEQEITDGVCGFRELCDWITLAMLGYDTDEMADWTVVSKSTFIKDERESVRTSVLGLGSASRLSI